MVFYICKKLTEMNIRRTSLYLIFLIVSSFISTSSYSQGYKTSFGLRGAWYYPSTGISIKHFVSGDGALEFILSPQYHNYYGGLTFSLLYEKHNTAFGVQGLRWNYGLGAYVGFYNDRWYYDRYGRYSRWGGTSLGLLGIFGMEYQITEVPFTISLDVIPSIPFDWWGIGITPSLAFRYYIK